MVRQSSKRLNNSLVWQGPIVSTLSKQIEFSKVCTGMPFQFYGFLQPTCNLGYPVTCDCVIGLRTGSNQELVIQKFPSIIDSP